ncbi:MAG TPA: hypothetical protein VLA36_06455 [Longimicrobiales bacterium]|nr:hypothetical protein [Longimicrobiales bacterium]
MTERMKPILGAMVTSVIVNYLGVYYFYGPIAQTAAPSGLELPRGVALLIAMIFFVLFFDWVNQQMKNPLKSAMVIALSQILLVDVYYVLNGQRPLTQALASVVVLLVGWGVTGMVYGKLLGASSQGG